MNKLFKLKKWLTLEDTATRLSSVLEEEVTFKDIIQLIIQGELKVSWYFQLNDGIEGVEVIKDNIYVLDPKMGEEFLSTDKPLRHITNALASINEGEFFRVVIDDDIDSFGSYLYQDYRRVSPRIKLEGIYNIDISSGDIQATLENIFFESEGKFELSIFTGIIVNDEFGDLYKLTNPDIKKSDKHKHNIPDWSHWPFPSKNKPKLDDLVILRSDLEEFEQKLLEAVPNNHLRGSKDSLALALGLMCEILSKTQTRYVHGSKPNFSQISKAIEQEAAKLSIGLEDISNLNRALSTSHKIIKKLTK